MGKNAGYSIATVLLLIMLLVQVYADVAITASQDDIENHGLQTNNRKFRPWINHIDCDSECNHRCSKASEHERCMKYCGICCAKCKCVPPGTFGNRDVCPCYGNWKTGNGKNKCP